MRSTPAVALTIAGSDSGGGAGIQADLLTFAAHQVHGTSAITAVTAQNTAGVRQVVALAPEFVLTQIRAVTEDLSPAAAKTGMLANAAVVQAVARAASEGTLPPLVVDPVLVSSTGHPLLEPDGVSAYRSHLIPRALVLTPNLRETAVLTGRPLEQLGGVEAMTAAAEALRALGATYVVVKGGHLAATGEAPDVVAGPAGTVVLPGHRVATPNDHGTGCTLSAAITANLALGVEPLEAVRRAKAYVHRALEGSADWKLGAGHGPVDHFGRADPDLEPT